MAQVDATAPFDVVLRDSHGRPMSEPVTTNWNDLTRSGITFTAIKAAVPRAVAGVGDDGQELIWQDGLGAAEEGQPVAFRFFIDGRPLGG